SGRPSIPSALPLGRAPSTPDSELSAGTPSRAFGTTPLRPLIDIAQPRLSLVVEQENGQAVGRSVTHEGDVCRIGTHPSNDITLDDPAVSRFHCRLVPDRDGWRVEDSGSLNGTRLQGLQIHSAVLPPEARLSIGNSTIAILGDAATSKEKTLVPMMPSFGALTGTGRAMRKLFALLEKVAASEINCFIHGESGTGKELVATEIVQRGVRADKPFVVVDCGAISPTLVESELFGHVRGAFTGADRDRVGAFEAADGGTVFLDEIGELPLEVQPKLLRALEQREIRRVGETRTRKVNVRVISATNRDLEREVNKGSFRGDLYFRIAVITVRVPPLRERTEDLPHLIRAFLAQLDASASEPLFGAEVLEELARHEWPGNVRELRNYVERSIVLQTARLSFAPPQGLAGGVAAPANVDVNIPYKVAKEALIDGFERAYVRAVIAACNGNMTKAARMAGIDRMYLHRLVQKHGSRDQLASSSDAEPTSQRRPPG
ncbi:MAG: sigma 54-dependent Fis family transcriptional regulator, partial [Labilithrix sp.]|nr:sigma 54-dependent Fis family transcriptional regulator [Labilithrix sp.]